MNQQQLTITNADIGRRAIMRSWRWNYINQLVEVVGVTPSGRVKVKPVRTARGTDDAAPIESRSPDKKPGEFLGTETYAFKAPGSDGRCDAIDRINDTCYLRFDLASVAAEADADKRARAAAEALNAVHAEQRIRHEWSKETMLSEVDRLQKLLDAARAAVEAR